MIRAILFLLALYTILPSLTEYVTEAEAKAVKWDAIERDIHEVSKSPAMKLPVRF